MIQTYAKEICEFLMQIPEVKSCSIYGSLSKGTFDEYSDVDIEIDVSGTDNGMFIKKLPELIAKEYDLIFYDYAPSLAPQKYILSVAMNTENPFMEIWGILPKKPGGNLWNNHKIPNWNGLSNWVRMSPKAERAIFIR